jgi:hypothetical protein
VAKHASQLKKTSRRGSCASFYWQWVFLQKIETE